MKKKIATERTDLFDPNMNITVFFDIIGEINAEAFILSIRKAFTAFEATMSKIVLTKEGEAYYELLSTSGCIAEITYLDWHMLMTENEKVPFSINNGELMRVFIKPSSDETSVFIMAHHLVGDGKSMIYFIERMMHEYVGKTSDFQPLRLITKESFPKGSQLPFWIKLWVHGYNRRWKKCGKTFEFNDYYDLHHTYWMDRQSIVLTEKFLPDQVKVIQKNAAGIGVSINSYIVTCFLKADRDLSSVGLAVNTRTNDNRSMSNQATGITVDYSYNDKISFEQNAQQVHKRIYKKLNNPLFKYFILQLIPLFDPPLIDSLMMHAFGLYKNDVSDKLSKVMGYSSDGDTSFGITNLTKLDIANEYDEYRIENLFFIPPVVSYSRHTVGIATLERVMTVTYHCMSDRYQENRNIIFEDAMNILSK